MRLSTLFLSFFISFSILYADYTGDVILTDSEYNDIGEDYPAGTETIYVQVYDSDVTGSLDVLLTSTTDTEGETVTLTEVPDLPGTFRGSISTMNASRILVDEDLLEDRIAQLRIEYPDHNVEVLRTRARGQR